MNNKKGLTLLELIATIIIVTILGLVAMPVYRGYVRKTKITEGKALLAEINAAEQIFYSRHGEYRIDVTNANDDSSLGVDSRRNKYFKTYSVSGDKEKFTATVTANVDGEDIKLTLTGTQSSVSEITESTVGRTVTERFSR